MFLTLELLIEINIIYLIEYSGWVGMGWDGRIYSNLSPSSNQKISKPDYLNINWV